MRLRIKDFEDILKPIAIFGGEEYNDSIVVVNAGNNGVCVATTDGEATLVLCKDAEAEEPATTEFNADNIKKILKSRQEWIEISGSTKKYPFLSDAAKTTRKTTFWLQRFIQALDIASSEPRIHDNLWQGIVIAPINGKVALAGARQRSLTCAWCVIHGINRPISIPYVTSRHVVKALKDIGVPATASVSHNTLTIRLVGAVYGFLSIKAKSLSFMPEFPHPTEIDHLAKLRIDARIAKQTIREVNKARDYGMIATIQQDGIIASKGDRQYKIPGNAGVEITGVQFPFDEFRYFVNRTETSEYSLGLIDQKGFGRSVFVKGGNAVKLIATN